MCSVKPLLPLILSPVSPPPTTAQQLAVIPEHSIFLGLSDGEVFYADLDSFSIINRLTRSKGASYFAVDWQKLRAHGGFRRELRIAVATKKKLQLYEYKRSTFVLTKVGIIRIRLALVA